MENVSEEVVFVYFGGKLISSKSFQDISKAHKYCEDKVSQGCFCVLRRMEYGRAWAKLCFRPKECI